jgi:D-beta-D-heptose 7-phosphate kinase/D-beta-D-heptose 1-phosphate adenosyltransferase
VIFPDINEFKKHFDATYDDNTLMVTTSGGFDPVHIGHLRCLRGTVAVAEDMSSGDETAIVVVIVNGDGFLIRKKGRPFMPHSERMEIIDGFEGIDFVVGWDDGTQTVEGAIKALEPDVFTKGGDRTDASNVPEFGICTQVGCDIMFGVGGGKIQSSSDLIAAGSDPDNFDITLEPDHIWMSRFSRRVEKPWGSEEILVETDRYVAKILTILSGHQLSRQYHEVKDETIMGLEGICAVEIGPKDNVETVFIEKGTVRRILPGTIHRFKHWDGYVRLLEISTPELDDVIRLEDDYSRT